MSNLNKIKPFLKWAGGKTQLINQLKDIFPNQLGNGLITRYIEPFIGGGAVFFYIAKSYQIEEFFISDINPELILAYQTIQKYVDDLIPLLFQLQTQYLSLNFPDRTNFYYQIRSQFNQKRQQIDFDKYNHDWLERTAQIIFLNRTCFNGLFRVNSKGEFNVPAGKYQKPTICDPDNLKAVEKVLQKALIYRGDFQLCSQYVHEKSLVYFDPPYKPLNKTSKFTSYSTHIFDDSEQLRLRDFYQQLDQKGAYLILSNSDSQNNNSLNNFFQQAYQKYTIKKVKANRSINSKTNLRGKINEIIITNY